AAHAQDAEPLAGDVHAHQLGWRPTDPAVGAQHGRAVVCPPGGAQHAQHGDVGGGVGQHVGRVADQDVALGGGRDVNVLVAHREVGNHPYRTGQLADGVGIQRVACGAHDAVEAV